MTVLKEHVGDSKEGRLSILRSWEPMSLRGPTQASACAALVLVLLTSPSTTSEAWKRVMALRLLTCAPALRSVTIP